MVEWRYACFGCGLWKQAGKRNWEGKQSEQQAVEENRSRVTGDYGKQLLIRRGEFVERSFSCCCETSGMRRCTLHGHENILRRLPVHAGAFNVSLILRKTLGAGTPRGPAAHLPSEIGPLSFLLVFGREC